MTIECLLIDISILDAVLEAIKINIQILVN